MSNVAPAWVVRKSGINHTVTKTGSYVVLRANRASEANLIFDNTDGSLDSTFFGEDFVEIYLGAVNSTNKVMEGYIDRLNYSQTPSGRRPLQLHVTDWGSYLAGKTVFENDFPRTTTPNDVMVTAGAELASAGLTTNVNDMLGQMKQPFRGTYVKDAWRSAVEVGEGDYFVDENKILQAFEENSRLLNFGGGTIQVVDDGTPSSDTVVIDHNFPYNYDKSSLERYRSVVATNGLFETYPTAGAGTFENSQMKLDDDGKTYSANYFQTGNGNSWGVENTLKPPVEFFTAQPTINDFTLDTVRLNVLDNSTALGLQIQNFNTDETGAFVLSTSMNINPFDWQNLTFILKANVTQSPIINVLLFDDNGDWWERTISPDLNGKEFTYLSYSLPTASTGTTNGWTANGTPTEIDIVAFTFQPSSGYVATDFLEYGLFHFSRRRRSTVTQSGTPATEKIIIDSSAKNFNSLSALALAEQSRTDREHFTGGFTIDGDPRWKFPAYRFILNFTNSLGNGTITANARIDEIQHILNEGVHKTTIKFNPSFSRP